MTSSISMKNIEIWSIHIIWTMVSVKPFKSKNRDKIYLDAPNPDLKKVVIEILEPQPNL